MQRETNEVRHSHTGLLLYLTDAGLLPVVETIETFGERNNGSLEKTSNSLIPFPPRGPTLESRLLGSIEFTRIVSISEPKPITAVSFIFLSGTLLCKDGPSEKPAHPKLFKHRKPKPELCD